jgi:hypothetical protein
VLQGGFRAIAVNVVNGGRDRIVINESAEGPPGVVDKIDRVTNMVSHKPKNNPVGAISAPPRHGSTRNYPIVAPMVFARMPAMLETVSLM